MNGAFTVISRDKRLEIPFDMLYKDNDPLILLCFNQMRKPIHKIDIFKK